MPKIVTFSSSKGGVGKSSVCVNLAGAISSREKTVSKRDQKVLIVDLDTQGSASHHLANKIAHFSGTIINAFQQNLNMEKIIHRGSETLHFIPCDMNFAHWSEYGKKDFTQDLQDFLKRASDYDYDYIFLDVPPTFSAYSLVPLFVSNYVILPVSAISGEPSIHGTENQLEIIEMVKKEDNPQIKVLGIVLTMVGRTKLSKEVVAYMEQHYPDLLFKSYIPQNAKITECSSLGKTIFSRSPTSVAAKSFVKLGEEFLIRINNDNKKTKKKK